MNAIIPTNQNLPTDIGLSVAHFDQAAARFLATRNSDRTRQTYARALADYRAIAENLRLDPFKADCLIAYT